jgi:hypothetical protein
MYQSTSHNISHIPKKRVSHIIYLVKFYKLSETFCGMNGKFELRRQAVAALIGRSDSTLLFCLHFIGNGRNPFTESDTVLRYERIYS